MNSKVCGPSSSTCSGHGSAIDCGRGSAIDCGRGSAIDCGRSHSRGRIRGRSRCRSRGRGRGRYRSRYGIGIGNPLPVRSIKYNQPSVITQTVLPYNQSLNTKKLFIPKTPCLKIGFYTRENTKSQWYCPICCEHFKMKVTHLKLGYSCPQCKPEQTKLLKDKSFSGLPCERAEKEFNNMYNEQKDLFDLAKNTSYS